MKRYLVFLFGAVCGVFLLNWMPSECESSKSKSKPKVTKANKAAKASSAKITYRGLLDCFPKGLHKIKKGKKKPITCEVSGAAFDGKQVILVSDKKIPGKGRSSMFSVPYEGNVLSSKKVKYWTQNTIRKTKKIEDLSVSPDGKYVFATSAIDRFRSDGKWDGFNGVLYWKKGQNKIHRFNSTLRDPKTKQIPFRECLKGALSNFEYKKGVKFFKVEGLAAIPGQTLLFGVREWGASYKVFNYTVQVIAVTYSEQGGKLVLGKECKRIFDGSLRMSKKAKKRVGLASLEFDRFHNRLYILTSFEKSQTAKGLGAFLWSISLGDLKQNKMPTLMRKPNGKPLVFAHKAEGLTVLNKKSLLVVHDDDRIRGKKPVDDPETGFYRDHHQMAYSIVTWK